MKFILRGGTICDPTAADSMAQKDLWIDDGRIAAPTEFRSSDRIYDITGCVVMSGAIDVHTHIGGGKVNLARLLLPRGRGSKACGAWKRDLMLSSPVPPTWEVGKRYIEMGYTLAVEPAIVPCNARHAHLEMGATPYLDTAGLVVLGNEDMLLEAIQQGMGSTWVRDYVQAMVQGHASLGVKVVNPGGVNAFRFGTHRHGLDVPHPKYRVTGREILRSLARAVDEIPLPHPLHVHCNDLGKPGNIATTLATLEAVEDHRIHLAHAQFHAYGADGPHGFSSAAAALADAVNRNPRISMDVGMVLFGQTATLSADIDHQYRNRSRAHPRKTIFQTIECQAACGIVPFRYRENQYVHSLQWTIGLELLLRIEEPSRVFLTTDHPNGGPFTAYPHLLDLLCSYDRRMQCFERLHPEAQAVSPLPTLRREYRLEEIAAMTRSGPAKALGLTDAGCLKVGSIADVVVYDPTARIDEMFQRPRMVFRRGELVVRDGQIVETAAPMLCDRSLKNTRVAFDSSEPRPSREMQQAWKAWYHRSWQNSAIHSDEFPELLGSELLAAAGPRQSQSNGTST